MYDLIVKYPNSTYAKDNLTREEALEEVTEYLNTLSHRLESITVIPVATQQREL